MDDRPHFDPEFLVGIEQVDKEHRQLFEIAGRVYDALSVDTDAALAAARVAIGELLAYTETHFASEEALMREAGYPDTEAHADLHRDLLLHARDMEMRAEFSEQSVPLELNHFISNWLVEHILASDKKFGDYMASRSARTGS